MQRQREAAPLNFVIRDLSPADLARLRDAPRTDLSTPKQFRDTHHRVARLIASGLRLTEVADRTGFSYGRITMLAKSPAMKELVAMYREKVIEAYIEAEEEYITDATRIRRKAMRHIEEHLDAADEAEELIPLKLALAVASDMADRTGFGKSSTKVNINADFAKALERAYAAQVRVIESRGLPPPLDRRADATASSPADSDPPSQSAGLPSSAQSPAPEDLPRDPVAGVPVERGAGPLPEAAVLRRRA